MGTEETRLRPTAGVVHSLVLLEPALVRKMHPTRVAGQQIAISRSRVIAGGGVMG